MRPATFAALGLWAIAHSALFSSAAQVTHAPKRWTILIYMDADNDLAPYAYWDLHEMEAGYRSGRKAAASTDRVNVVVQLNTPGAEGGRRIQLIQSSQVYDPRTRLSDFRQARPESVRSPVISRAPLRREDGKTVPVVEDFERFLEWGMREFPSDHVMVVTWGHGRGWSTPGSGERLDVPGLHSALRTAEKLARNDRPIDLYASDSCLMQTTEVAYELADSARFVLGSAQIQNFLGLPYRRMLFELNTDRFSGERNRPENAGKNLSFLKNDEPALLARMLPRIFKMSLERNGLHGRQLTNELGAATLSAIDTEALRARLAPALTEVGKELNRFFDLDPVRSVWLSQDLDLGPSFLGGSRDLQIGLDAIHQLAEKEQDLPLLAALDRANSALQATLVASALGSDYPRRTSGLAVWLPTSPMEFEDRISSFASSSFFARTGNSWRSWLAKLNGLTWPGWPVEPSTPAEPDRDDRRRFQLGRRR